MKKIVGVFIIVCAFVLTTKAQYTPNDDYHQEKRYIQDPYNPALAGICSYLLPGMGQIYLNETKRGIYFLTGYFGSYAAMGTGVYLIYANAGKYGRTPKVNTQAISLIIVGSIGAIGIWAWSIIDAVQLANIKNLVYRNTGKITFNLEPTFINITDNSGQSFSSTGLRFAINF